MIRTRGAVVVWPVVKGQCALPYGVVASIASEPRLIKATASGGRPVELCSAIVLPAEPPVTRRS